MNSAAWWPRAWRPASRAAPSCWAATASRPLGDRLGEVQQEINEVRQTLSERIAEVSMEVVVLKSVREIGSRVFWSAIGAAGTISGGVVGIVLTWWLGGGR